MITEQEEGISETTIYQDGVMISMDGSKKAAMIVDSKKSQCTWFNHSSRKFARGCQMFSDSVNNIKAKGDAYMEGIMSQLSPEQQAMMRQDMENAKRNSSTFQTKKIGDTNFQGFGVNKYHFLIEGSPFAEVWLSPDLYKALLKEVDVKKIEKIFGDTDTDTEHTSDFGQNDMQELLQKEITTLAEKENAYVIKAMRFISRDNPSDTEIFGSQVIEIKTKKIDLNQYNPPSDYKAVESFFDLVSGFNMNDIQIKDR